MRRPLLRRYYCRTRKELRLAYREAWKTDWSATNRRAGLLCLPVIAAWLFIGVERGHHERAVLAVAGAVTVAFGSFQRLGRNRVGVMLITLAGIALATWVGCVAGYAGRPWLMISAAAFGFVYGALTLLGFGVWWIGLQCMIGLFVYGAHPAAPLEATWNALYVVVGGLSQLIVLTALQPITDHWYSRADRPFVDTADPLLQAVFAHMVPASTAGQYGVRVAVALAVATAIGHFTRLPNGYWVPMTAAILLKPDLRETLIRGFNRLIGTISGAAIVTLLIALTRPTPPMLAVCLLVAIWACFAVQRVHYAFFAMGITAYVVLLLSLLGLPEVDIALHRLVATLIGAAIALTAHLLPVRWIVHERHAQGLATG